MPEVGSDTKQGDAFGSIEAVKAVADLYAPVAGKVTEVNAELGRKSQRLLTANLMLPAGLSRSRLPTGMPTRLIFSMLRAYTDLTTA